MSFSKFSIARYFLLEFFLLGVIKLPLLFCFCNLRGLFYKTFSTDFSKKVDSKTTDFDLMIALLGLLLAKRLLFGGAR